MPILLVGGSVVLGGRITGAPLLVGELPTQLGEHLRHLGPTRVGDIDVGTPAIVTDNLRGEGGRVTYCN